MGELLVAGPGSAHAFVETWFDEQTGDHRLVSALQMYEDIVTGERIPDVLVLDGITGFSTSPLVMIPVLEALGERLVVVLVGDHHEVYVAAALLEALRIFRRWMEDNLSDLGPGGFPPGNEAAVILQPITTILALGDLRRLGTMPELPPTANAARRLALAFLTRSLRSDVAMLSLMASVGVGVVEVDGEEVFDTQTDARRWRRHRRSLAEIRRSAGVEEIGDEDGPVESEDDDGYDEDDEIGGSEVLVERGDESRARGSRGSSRRQRHLPHPGSRAGMEQVPGMFAVGWGWCGRCGVRYAGCFTTDDAGLPEVDHLWARSGLSHVQVSRHRPSVSMLKMRALTADPSLDRSQRGTPQLCQWRAARSGPVSIPPARILSHHSRNFFCVMIQAARLCYGATPATATFGGTVMRIRTWMSPAGQSTRRTHDAERVLGLGY